jgi:DNA-binding response OmpR family regulator
MLKTTQRKDKCIYIDNRYLMRDFIRHILICDDVADDSFLIKTILEAEECQLEIVDSGAAVLTYLETNPKKPDLLILDVMMPVLDGFEVVRQIRQSAEFQSLSILLVTSMSEDITKNNSDIKVDGYIQKPIDPDAVITQVRAMLDRSYGKVLSAE